MTKTPLMALALFAFLSGPAMADVYQFSLTIDGCSGKCGPGPFGTVTVSDLATPEQVKLEINVEPNFFVQTGQPGSAVAFNLDPNVSLSIVSSTLEGWTLDNSLASALKFATFGSFEYSLNCCKSDYGGGAKQIGSVALVLSGDKLTAKSFTLQKSKGNNPVYFAVDILSTVNTSTNSPKAATGSNTNTGPVGADTYKQLPDGGMTLILLGAAFFGLESLRRRTGV